MLDMGLPSRTIDPLQAVPLRRSPGPGRPFRGRRPFPRGAPAMHHIPKVPRVLGALGAALIALLGAASPARAGFVFITDRADLAGTSQIDWASLGAAFDLVANP